MIYERIKFNDATEPSNNLFKINNKYRLLFTQQLHDVYRTHNEI